MSFIMQHWKNTRKYIAITKRCNEVKLNIYIYFFYCKILIVVFD